MSSSQGDKRTSDVEMGEATSQTPVPASSVEVPACIVGHLSFRDKLVRRKGASPSWCRVPILFCSGRCSPSSSVLAVAPDHGAEVLVPQNAGTLVDTSVPCVLDALVHPAGSSTTPILVEDKERAAESMPPPPARKEIVLALRAPRAAPIAQLKGRKRKFTKGGDGNSSQQGSSNLALGHRGKVCSHFGLLRLARRILPFFLALLCYVSITILSSRSSCR